MKRKYLGIPIPIIAGLLALTLVVGGVFAGIMLTKEIPSRVSIVVPYGMTAWQNEAYTIELVELDFGDIAANDESDYVSFYLKNEGENDSYVAMSQTGLDGNHLTLNWQGQDGSCPTDSQIVYYDFIDSGQKLTSTVPTATDTMLPLGLGNTTSFEVGDVVLVDDEQMLVDVVNIDHLVVTRGYNDTTATTHSAGAKVYIVKQVPLAPDGVMNVVLFLTADDEATTKLDVEFTTIVNASDIPY